MKKLEPPLQVTLGDGHSLEGTAEGTVVIESLLPDGRTATCRLENTVFVPGLSYSLLSVSKASSTGNTTRFNKAGCEIVNDHGNVIAFATRVGNLYHLEYCRKSQSANVADNANKEKLWHRRYGHLGEENLKRLAKDKLVEHFDYDVEKSIGFCETCVGGKHHRAPFTTSTTKTTVPLELVHSDVCGKMQHRSLGGAEYFLTFTDDHTRYSWVYMLKTKDQDQVYECFREWKALVEKQTKHKLKTLRTDNGGEYTSKKLEQYLKSEGIRHEKTVPKTPEQNGVSERLNRTLVEAARSMLLDANLSKSFWAEAVNTAAYLKNRSPTKALQGKTPFEAWYGKKPNVEHLKVFGCMAYAHIPKDERGKFDSKARKCTLLGYDEFTKGYRLYDPQNKKIIYSRDVRFDEQPEDTVIGCKPEQNTNRLDLC
jgi:transposase InsO family protein